MLEAIRQERALSGERIEGPLLLTLDETNRVFPELLGADCDLEFYEFCRMANGVDWNGLLVYSIASPGDDPRSNIFDNNLGWRDSEDLGGYVIYGDSGMDLPAKSLRTGQFELLMKPSIDKVERFASFDKAITQQLANCHA